MSASEDLKSSAHVWGGNNADNNDTRNDPPAYSGTVETVQANSSRTRSEYQRRKYDPITDISSLAAIPFSRYNIPEATVAPDRISLTSIHPQLINNSQSLLSTILEQAELPPMPMLRIMGTHIESVGGSQKLDFDLMLNLTHLLDLSGPKWRIKSAQSEPLPNEPGVRNSTLSGHQGAIAAWTSRFVKDKSDNKSFTLTRSVINLPTDLIEGQVRTLLASLKYRGKAAITFPIHHSKVIVQKQPSNWLVSMLRIYPEKKYEVVEAIWDLSSGNEGTSQTDHSTGSNILIREWWTSWAPAITNAILVKRISRLGIDEWIEGQMGYREKERNADWGTDYGR